MAEKCHRTKVMSSRVGKTTTEPHINTWTNTLTEQRDPQYWERSFDQFRMTAGDSIAINASIICPGCEAFAPGSTQTNSDEAAETRLAPQKHPAQKMM
jgi:hypothetical protein